MYKIKYILFLLGLFFIQSTIFSQQAAADIEIIHFNSSASYAYGSGISIHINPKGIFKLGDSQSLGSQNVNNNVFILELSSENGSFDNPITLATIYDFYTPLINGVIPSSIIAGDYKLRVKASLGLQSSDGNIDFETSTDYGIVYSDEVDIQISAQTLNSGLVLNNPTPTDSNVFNCLLDNSVNPSIGSLIVSSDSNSSGFSSPTVYITDFESNNLTITLFDIINSTSQNISTTTLDNSIAFDIPDDLQIGTYTIEVQEIINESGLSNISSFSFLWHRNSTSLTNLDNEEICVGSEVGFSIATDSEDGVGGNYTGSYYSLDFGDGTNPEIFTHAYLLVSNQFVHEFQGASCLLDGENGFEVTKLLYNNKNCLGYEENGQGKTTEVSASIPPTANFDFSDQYCINPEIVENLVILNETDLGQYSSSSSSNCLDLSDYFWFVQRPSDTDFLAINAFSFPLWTTNIDINGDNLPDLIIPDSDLSGDPGCWNFRLSAENNEGALCNSGVFAEGTVQVLVQPDVNFNIQDLTGNIVSEICPGETVTLNNLTDALELDCQDLNFEWDINPTQPDEIDNHCSFVQNTNPFSESPIVTFNEPGIYQITLTVTNGVCEAETFSYTFTVQGTPGVTLNANVGDEQVCLDNIDISNPFIVDFSTQYSPQYTAEPFEPNSFSWEVTGQGITEDDYSYINGTSNNSDFPVIEFYSFECYNLSVSVDSACETSSTDSFNFSIDQNPIANFEILNTSGEVVGLICPGDTVQLNDLSEISGEGCQDVTYLWGISALVPGTPAQHCAPATGSTWTDPSPYIEFIEPGVFEISVQVTAGNCPVGEYTDTIIVEGPPSVSIDVDGESSVQVCLDSISSSVPNQIDFSQTYTPVYSNDTGSNGQLYNSPINYLWEISGLGITSDDYAFVNGNQPSSSAFPVIEFYSFGDYTITTTVEGNCEVSDENIFIYSINEIPSITNPDSDFEQIICSGEFTELLEFTSSVENTTFTWNFSAADTYLSGYNNETINTGNLPTQNIFNSSNIPGQVIFQVTPSTIDCEGETKLVIITVNPKPIIDNISEVICTGAEISLTPIEGTIPSGTTYSWNAPVSSPVNAITGGTSGIDTTLISESELINSTISSAVLTYTITPSTADDCVGDSFTVSVTVNPLGQVNNPANQEFCNDDNINISFNTENSGGVTTYAWTNSNSAIGLSNSGTGNLDVVATNTTNNPITSTVVVTPSFEGCDGTPQTFTITVNPKPIIDNISEVICTGAEISLTPIEGTIPSGTTYSWNAPVSSPVNAITGGTSGIDTTLISESELINSTISSAVLTYTITPSTADDCVGDSFTVSVTVNPLGQVNNPANQEFCNDDNINISFNTENSGGVTTYAWTNSNSAIGLSNSGTGNLDVVATNTTNNPITSTVVVTPSFEGCDGTPQTFTITVNPTPQLNDPEDQVIFTGESTTAVNLISSVAGVTYSWTANEPSGNLIGLTQTNGDSDQILSETLVNNTSGPLVLTYVITPILDGVECEAVIEEYTITINPSVTMLTVEDEVVCNGDEVNVDFQSANSGGTTSFEWTNDTESIGLSISGSGNLPSFTAINNGTSPIVATLTVTPTFENGGISNEGNSQTFTITVNPSSQVDEIEDQFLCNEETTTAITFNTQNNSQEGTTIYTWVNDTPSIGLASSGSGDITSFTGINNSTLPITATITVTPTYTNEGLSCDGPEEIFAITVNPTAQVDDPQNQIICNAEITSVEFTTENTGGTTTYTWSNDNIAIGLGDLGVGNISSFAGVNEGTSPIIANITVIPTFTDNGVSCTGPAKTFTITVNPTAQVDQIDSQILCNDEQTTLISFTTENTLGTTTYTWANDTPAIGLAVSGSGDITSFSAVNGGTEPVIATIVVTPIFEGCDGPVETFTITVNPTAEMNDPADIVVCDAEVTDIVDFTTDNTGGETTYSWINDMPAIGLSVSGSGNLPSFTAINTGTEPIVATIEVTPLFTDDINCDGISETFTITVNPTAQVDQPVDQIICDGETTSITFTTENTGGTTTYSWENDTPSINLSSSGNGNIESLNVSNSGTSPVAATVTVTPTFENGGVTCQGNSQTFTITVNPSSQVDEIEDQFLCNEETTTAITFNTQNNSQEGTTIYTWVNDTPSIGLASSGSGDITSFTGINNSTLPITATITVTPTYTNEGLSCDGPEEIFAITVNPTAQVDDPQNQIICNAEITSVEFTTENTGGTTTYTWSNDNIAIGLGDLGVGNISSFAGVNEGTSPIIANITVIPTFTDNGVSCTGPAKTFTITVNPTAQVDQIDSQILCNDEQTTLISFTTENTLGTTTYTWANDTPAIGLAVSGSGDITSFSAVNGGTEPVIATIVVTPIFEGCDGPVETFTITVNPTAEMNDPADIVVCDAEVTDIVDFTTDNTGGETTYSWINDMPAIGLSVSGSGNLPSFTAINTGTEPIVATIEVTPLFTDDINCDGISETFTITVNPTAQVDQPVDQIICNGDTTDLIDFTTNNSGGTTTYSWINDTPSIGLAASGTGQIPPFIAGNANTQPIIATIEVTPIYEGCNGATETFKITVNGNVDPKPTISNYNGFQISCFGANDGFINLLPEGAMPDENIPFYSFEWTGPNNFTSNNQNISALEPGIYIVTIIDSLNCVFEFEYEINEPDPLEILVDEQSDVQCNGIFDGILSVSPLGGAAPYTYEWTKDGIFYSNDQNIENLEPGTYVLFLNDSNSCGPVSQIFEINQPDTIEISLENSVEILCFGENTGSVDVSVIGGTPEQISTEVSVYNYSWTGPNGYNSNDAAIFNLFAGIYNLTVTDSLGCQEFFEVELVEPEDLIINFATIDNSCYESNDGTITLDIQGGIEPYQIFWSNFANGPVQTNLSAGIYEVTVIDGHDCEEIINIEIVEAPIFDIDPVYNNISCFGANDGSINLNVIGGIEPVFVTWDDDPTSGEERNNLAPGTYNVLIEDSSVNNCFISQSFVILEPQELSLSSIIENAIDCDIVNSGSIDLQVIGGTPPYSFQWNNGSISEDLFNIAPGNYSVSVVDSRDCEIVEDFTIDRQEDITTSLDITFEADCENDIPYQITTIDIEGGVAPYQIIWSSGEISGDNNETMTSSQNGTVLVDVFDSLGCQTQVIFDIDLFSLGSPGFSYSSPGLIECETLGVGDVIQFNNASTGDYISVDWNFGDNGLTIINQENPTHIYNQPGTYVVTQTVYYEYGCVDVYEDVLYVTDGYGLVLPNTFTPNGDGINDTIRPWFKCMTNVEISIYDTFGSLLYVEAGEDIYGWDGSINGQMAENGNYIIVVRATTLFGEIIDLNGPITLIR